MDAPPDRRAAWFADLAAAVTAPAHQGTGVVVIDPRSGHIVASSPGAAELVGQPLPVRVRDLVDDGVVARPDGDALAARVAAWRSSPGRLGKEDAHAWTAELRVHPAGKPSRRLRVEAVLHVRPVLDAEAVTVVLRPVDEPPRPVEPGTDQWSSWDVYDAEMRAVALDPAPGGLGGDDEARFGVAVAALLTPEDLRRVLPAALAVIEGRATEAQYSFDFPRPRQAPLRMESTLRRVDGPDLDGPRSRYLIRSRPTNVLRDVIVPGVLTARQDAVVTRAFAGMQAHAIAHDLGVALPTVRSHLAAAYRRLGVAGRDELVARYHPPVTVEDSTTVVIGEPDASPPATSAPSGRRPKPPVPGMVPITEHRRLRSRHGPVDVTLTRWTDPSDERRPLPVDRLFPRGGPGGRRPVRGPPPHRHRRAPRREHQDRPQPALRRLRPPRGHRPSRPPRHLPPELIGSRWSAQWSGRPERRGEPCAPVEDRRIGAGGPPR